MDGLPLGIFEFVISGSVLLIGIWQLISIHRTINAREAKEAAERAEAEAGDAGASEDEAARG